MNIIGEKYGRLTVLKEVDSYIRPSGQKEKDSNVYVIVVI